MVCPLLLYSDPSGVLGDVVRNVERITREIVRDAVGGEPLPTKDVLEFGRKGAGTDQASEYCRVPTSCADAEEVAPAQPAEAASVDASIELNDGRKGILLGGYGRGCYRIKLTTGETIGVKASSSIVGGAAAAAAAAAAVKAVASAAATAPVLKVPVRASELPKFISNILQKAGITCVDPQICFLGRHADVRIVPLRVKDDAAAGS